MSRADFAPVFELALKHLNPEAIVAGFRATGLCPFNQNAVHYEKLTEIARRKYKNITFCEENFVPTVDNSFICKLVFAELERFLGAQTIAVFNSKVQQETTFVSLDNVPSAFEIWHYFKGASNAADELQLPKSMSDAHDFIPELVVAEEETVDETREIDIHTYLEMLHETPAHVLFTEQGELLIIKRVLK